MRKKINSAKIFHAAAFLILLILAIVCILPIILIVVASFMDETTLLPVFSQKIWIGSLRLSLETVSDDVPCL